jgi:hypothetical protein
LSLSALKLTIPELLSRLPYQLKITLMDLRALRAPQRKVRGFQEMGTLRCDGCGEEFVIGHQPSSVDKKIAERPQFDNGSADA